MYGGGAKSVSDVLGGFDGERVVVVFVYDHRRVFTCSSTLVDEAVTSDDLTFNTPVEITSRVHPHHSADPTVFSETYINVGHTTVVKVKDGAEDPNKVGSN
jgi:hypothetical protein